MKNITQSLIYILDDEKAHGDLLHQHLTEKEFEVKAFVDSQVLFENIELKKPMIVFLDYHISQNEFQHGNDVLIKIKQKFPAIEVVMYAGEDSVEVAKDVLQHGAYDYVIKGRTAVHKAEIIAENIKLKNESLLETLKFRFYTFGLMGLLVAFIITVVTFYKLHFFSDADVHGEDFFK
jgi:DNA-binding NtrC family response regulator